MLPGNTPTLMMGGESGNDSYTKLLLHFDDMTLMNVARGGTPCVCTPYNSSVNATTKKFGTGSMSFAGGGASYLIVKNSPDFDFGAGSFTVDWWEYRTAAADGAAVVRRQSDNVPQGLLLGHTAGNRNQCYMSSDGTNWNISNIDVGPVTLNVWNHFAVVRNGNTFYHFKNGAQTATWSSSLALIAAPASHTMCLGHWNGIGFQGYLDEIRFSKGIARWTSNFNPPQRAYGPDPDYSAWHTARLYHFHTTNAAGAQFEDSSLYATGVTGGNGYGHPYDAFAGGRQGSSYWDGANYYNVLTGTEDLNFGNGDFTIDWRDWRSDAASEGRPGMVRWTTTKTYQPFLIGWQSGGNLYAYASNDAASWNVVSGLWLGPITSNVWSHRAIVRKDSTFYGFKDGVLQQALAANTLPIYSVGNDPMFVGVWNAEGAQYWGYGLKDELRISKGIARWTANFTPPAAPYAITPNETVLLMHLDDFQDSSPYKRGNAAGFGTSVTISTVQSKFGGKSALFDGASGIGFPNSPSFDFESGDFTVDLWFNCTTPTSGINQIKLIGKRDAGATLAGSSWRIRRAASADVMSGAVFVPSGQLTINGTTNFTNTTNPGWHHLAFVRTGNVLKLFLDGVQEGGNLAITEAVTLTPGSGLGIGAEEAVATTNNWIGYIDEVRITKGRALWTANFTPPTQPGV